MDAVSPMEVIVVVIITLGLILLSIGVAWVICMWKRMQERVRADTHLMFKYLKDGEFEREFQSKLLTICLQVVVREARIRAGLLPCSDLEKGYALSIRLLHAVSLSEVLESHCEADQPESDLYKYHLPLENLVPLYMGASVHGC